MNNENIWNTPTVSDNNNFNNIYYNYVYTNFFISVAQ